MFLSNPRPFFLLTISCVIFFQACGSSQSNVNSPVSLPGETKSEFPFPTKEPEVYQGDFVIGDRDGERINYHHIARKGDKWLIDYYHYNEPGVTWLHTDKLYYIDHKKKLFTINEGSYPALDDETFNFFKGKEYREFDEIGREGNLIIYGVRESDASKGAILIYIDPANGMIMKQEFKSRNESGVGFHLDYVYEVKNLTFEVDDGLFAIPEDYRKVTWAKFPFDKIAL